MTTTPYGIQEGSTDVVCGPCQFNSTVVQAERFCVDCSEYLCKMCSDYHMKLSITRDHKLSNMEGIQLMKDVILMKDTCTEQCQLHYDETIKYFCKEHSVLGCAVCCVLNHRSCNNVEYIPELAKHLTNSKEFGENERQLQDFIEKSRKLSMKAEEKMKILGNSYSEVQRIKTFRSEINDLLDKMENELLISLENLQKRNMNGTKYALDTCKEINKETETVLANNETLRKKGKYCNLFVSSIRVREKVGELERRLRNVDDALKMKQYMFLPNLSLLKTIKGLNGLGELKEVGLKDDIGPPQRLVPCKDLNAKSTTDGLPCKITSCATLPDGKSLILSDFNNKTVKKFNIEDMSLSSEIQISGRPWDLAILEDAYVGVTAPCEKKILFIKVDKDLAIERDTSFESECHGIAQYNKEKLVVTFGDHNRIEMMNFSGKIVSSICNQQKQPTIFQKPLFVTTNPKADMLYVSNFGDSSIVCLKPDGSIMWKYTDSQLSGPLNIAVDSGGMVYVCGKKSNNILQISENCKQDKVCVAVEDLEKQPYSICYNEKYDRFYVGMLDIDNVKVFQPVRDAP